MIHSTAIIDPSAKLGSHVEVGAYTVIGAEVEIGDGTKIGPHAVIKGPTRIGRDNQIFQFSSVGERTQALTPDDDRGVLEIGDRNIIREFTTLNRGNTAHGGVTKIGNDNLLMAYTHVAHDCHLGNHIIMSNAASLAGHATVEDHAILGGFTLVHQFVRIGEHAFSGMGSAINCDVPPYVTVAGNHASAFGINKEGLKRRGFSPEALRGLHKAYMLLIRARGKREAAIEELAPFIQQHPEVKKFVEFIQNSTRAVVRHGRE